MQRWDNPAHKVLQAKVNKPGLTEIVLTNTEKETLKEWCFIHIIRSPYHRQRCVNLDKMGFRTHIHNQYLDQNRRDFITRRRQYIDAVATEKPDDFAKEVKRLGREEVEKRLMIAYEKLLKSGTLLGGSNGVDMYQRMLQSGQHRTHLKSIRGMKWVWLRSEHDFLIGDNPFDRCDSRNGLFNCPLKSETLEVFFPMGRHLCLWMHRRMRRATEIVITEAQTKELNRRQLQNCWAKAWGPRPDVFSTEGRFSQTSPIP